MKTLTVLVTASGSHFAPGIIKCIKANGEREVCVVGADASDDPTNSFFVDCFYQTPKVNDPEYLSTMLDICQNANVDIYLPQMSAELPILLDNLDQFKKRGTIVSITQNPQLNVANDKLRLFKFMRAKGIPTPNFKSASTLDEFDSAIQELGFPQYPVVVKIPNSSGSRGVRVIDENVSKFDLFASCKPSSITISLAEMRAILSDKTLATNCSGFPTLLLMEYLPGDEYDIDLLAGQGRVLYIAGRRNLEMSMSITQSSILEKNERAELIANELVDALQLDGNVGLDFKFDSNGDVQLLEINPRIDATVSIFAAGGLNLPYLRIKQLLGEPLPNVDVHYGTRLKRRYLETFVDSSGQLINW